MKVTKVTYFAGGCFWCMEYAFDKSIGVINTTSGYGGGNLENPTYQNHDGHREMLRIEYDPYLTNYENLLDLYWQNIDPTDASGQFFDRGESYKTAIYYQNNQEKEIAEKSKVKLSESNKFEKEIVTDILPFKNFYKAEDYHQKYYKKNPERYNTYKNASGRESFKKENWQ